MTLVRGRSSHADLAKLGHLIHLALFALRAQGYWEYVQSKSNWADDISRLGVNDPWWRCHGFEFYSSYLPTIFFPAAFCCCHSHLWIPFNALGSLVHWVIPCDTCRAGSSLEFQVADQWWNWSVAMYMSHSDNPKQTWGLQVTLTQHRLGCGKKEAARARSVSSFRWHFEMYPCIEFGRLGCACIIFKCSNECFHFGSSKLEPK